MPRYVLTISDALLAQRRDAIRSRWDKDRKGLSAHYGHVLKRAHLLTAEERRQLLEVLTALGITTEAQEDATTAA